MRAFCVLLKRNIKLFFKDKAMFFTSLITPLILLVLYSTFLLNVYKDSFMLSIPPMFKVDENIIDGIVGGQLTSSLLAVSCVTVAFCSNMLMVQDKVTGARRDLNTTPVNASTLSLSYYLACLVSTLIVCFIALGACLIYLAITAWYLTVADVLLMCLDVFLIVMFGTALSSVINFFLSSQGQISAVGSIISSCYGFICGAYMPISSFSESLQKVIMFLPGTYGTSLIRNHAMRGGFEALADAGLADKAIKEMKDAVDCNIYFFDNKVQTSTMFIVLIATVLVLIGAYVLLNKFIKSKKQV